MFGWIDVDYFVIIKEYILKNIYKNKVLTRSSPIILQKSVFTCRKAEFALSTLALVATFVGRVLKDTVIQIEKALINDRLRVLKVS